MTLAGAQYPLLNATIQHGGPALISNMVIESPLLISMASGSLLVTVNRDGWIDNSEDVLEDLETDFEPDED